jgi:hypothetical protein
MMGRALLVKNQGVRRRKIMNAKLVGFFSGFPTSHFTDSIADA